jgi:hypothetical protein
MAVQVLPREAPGARGLATVTRWPSPEATNPQEPRDGRLGGYAAWHQRPALRRGAAAPTRLDGFTRLGLVRADTAVTITANGVTARRTRRTRCPPRTLLAGKRAVSPPAESAFSNGGGWLLSGGHARHT